MQKLATARGNYNEKEGMVALKRSSPLFAEISKKFYTGLGRSQQLSVDEIDSVQNPELWRMYQSKRAVIKESLGAFH